MASKEAKQAVVYLSTLDAEPERIADVIESEFPGEMTREQVISGVQYCAAVRRIKRARLEGRYGPGCFAPQNRVIFGPGWEIWGKADGK